MAQININYTVFIAGRSAKHNPLSSLIKVTGTILIVVLSFHMLRALLNIQIKPTVNTITFFKKIHILMHPIRVVWIKPYVLYYVILWTMAYWKLWIGYKTKSLEIKRALRFSYSGYFVEHPTDVPSDCTRRSSCITVERLCWFHRHLAYKDYFL